MNWDRQTSWWMNISFFFNNASFFKCKSPHVNFCLHVDSIPQTISPVSFPAHRSDGQSEISLMQVSALVAGILFKCTTSDQKKSSGKKKTNYKDMQNEHEKKQTRTERCKTTMKWRKVIQNPLQTPRRSCGAFAPLSGSLLQLVLSHREDRTTLSKPHLHSQKNHFASEAAHFNRRKGINIEMNKSMHTQYLLPLSTLQNNQRGTSWSFQQQ